MPQNFYGKIHHDLVCNNQQNEYCIMSEVMDEASKNGPSDMAKQKRNLIAANKM